MTDTAAWTHHKGNKQQSQVLNRMCPGSVLQLQDREEEKGTDTNSKNQATYALPLLTLPKHRLTELSQSQVCFFYGSKEPVRGRHPFRFLLSVHTYTHAHAHAHTHTCSLKGMNYIYPQFWACVTSKLLQYLKQLIYFMMPLLDHRMGIQHPFQSPSSLLSYSVELERLKLHPCNQDSFCYRGSTNRNTMLNVEGGRD